MSISYEEALATLQSMFGAPWTRETLDAVLRHQQGHMENTVDFILRHSGKDPKVLVDQIKAGVNPDATLVSSDAELARQLSQQENSRSRSAARSATGPGVAAAPVPRAANQRGRGTPTVLPEDFLRVPNAKKSPAQMLHDDEALARMLQDELFSEELRRNPDFAHLAGGRPRISTTAATASSRSSAGTPGINFGSFPGKLGFGGGAGRGQQQQQGSASQRNMNDVNIMEKISELGDTARRRLQMLAAQFNATNMRPSPTAAATTGGAGGSSGASERRGLLDDDDDAMELAARKDL